MTWIPSYASLGTHPKLEALCERLNIDEVQAVGHLHFFWWWVITYKPHGDISGITARLAARAAHWPGDAESFLAALLEIGFIEADPDQTLWVHDWEHYGGQLELKRQKNAAYQATHRARVRAHHPDTQEPSALRKNTVNSKVSLTSSLHKVLENRTGKDRKGEDTTGEDIGGEEAGVSLTSSLLGEEVEDYTPAAASDIPDLPYLNGVESVTDRNGKTPPPASLPITGRMKRWWEQTYADRLRGTGLAPPATWQSKDWLAGERDEMLLRYRERQLWSADWIATWQKWMLHRIKFFIADGGRDGPPARLTKGSTNGYESPAERQERELLATITSYRTVNHHQGSASGEFDALPEADADRGDP
jgi:hypothetical protein